MKPSAVDAAFRKHLAGVDSFQRVEHTRLKFGLRVQRLAQAALGVEHEVDVVGRGLGAVPKKPDGMLAVVGAAHVSAKERGRGALLLRIPGSAAAGEVTCVDVPLATLLKVFVEARPGGADAFLRLAAIKQVKARRNVRGATGKGFNNVTRQMAGAWQDRFQELLR